MRAVEEQRDNQRHEHRPGVRRPAGRWTPTIQRLLGAVADAGIPEVPRPLGLDDHGREVVSYIPGDTVADEDRWPPASRSDVVLSDVGQLLRRVHDATEDFGGGSVLPWRLTDAAVAPGQVVCHNDVAPYNLVWRSGEGLVGLIDWDFASPGDRRVDVAFVLWQFAPLHHSELTQKLGWSSDVDRLSRVRTIVDAYGLKHAHRVDLADYIIDRMIWHRDTIRSLADAGHDAFQFHIERGDLDDIARSAAFVDESRSELETALIAG